MRTRRTPETPSSPPASLFRRLAAGVYDLLLLAGLLMVAGFIAIAARHGEPVPPGTLSFQLSLLALIALFYAWFWSHGGQTLGMRSWRLKVEKLDGGPLTITTALLRFAASLLSVGALGLGVLWIVVDPEKRTWHDRLTGTRVVQLQKNS